MLKQHDIIDSFREKAITKIPFLLGIDFYGLDDSFLCCIFNCLEDVHISQLIPLIEIQDLLRIDMLLEDIANLIKRKVSEAMAISWKQLRADPRSWLMIYTWNGWEKRSRHLCNNPPGNWHERFTEPIKLTAIPDPHAVIFPSVQFYDIRLYRQRVDYSTRIAWYA